VLVAVSIDEVRREMLVNDWTERAAFERCVTQLGDTLMIHDDAGFSSSWVAFISAAGIRFAGEVPAPMPTVARWQRGAWVAPYMRALKQWRPITLALVDGVSARIYRYAEGVLSLRRRFDVHVADGHADRLRSATSQHFHQGTHGATAADEVSNARVQARDQVVRQVAAQLIRSGGGAGLIVGGNDAAVHALIRQLPESIASRALILPGIEMHTPDSVLRDMAAGGASTLRNAEDERVIAELTEAVGARGRGVAGRDAVLEAVVGGRAQRVLLSLRFLDADALAAEEIVEEALSDAVDVEVVSGHAADRLEREGAGAMASLRYVPVPLPPLVGVA